MREKFVLRVRILSLFAILAAILLIVRLYFIQIVHGDDYRADALGQYVKDSGDMTDRGDIFFRKKDGAEVAAAITQGGWRVAINPKILEDDGAAYDTLRRIVTVDKSRFDASAAKKDDPYEEVAFRLSDDQAKEVRTAEIQGVTVVRDEWRFYPGGELAAHALGFVAFRGEKKSGVYGLERYWEDTLRHDNGGLYVNPFAEIFSNVGALVTQEPEATEGNLVTTLEPSVQQQLEVTLDAITASHSPKTVGGIVMDPQTGEILALGMRPAFDPNTYNVVENQSVFQNPLIESIYEMGSILKPLTMAAAIDVNAVSPNTTYNDKGCITKSGAKFCNFDLKARGVVNMQEVLSQSLNTGVSFAVDKMGNQVFGEYVKKFGLGEETGIDLPNEAAGNINSLYVQGAADIDFASASFGQSIAISPIAMTRALASLANKGKLPEPHLVKAIRYKTGVVRNIEQADQVQVLKPETAETVTNMLVKVYDDALLEGALKQEHYSVAAKTGTAQIAIPGGGGYYKDRYLHSFFGYFPAHDPKFIVFLFAIEPHGEMYASRTLARPFSEISKFLINYYDVPPDR